MSTPRFTLGVPYYSQMEFVTETIVTSRQLYLVRNVEPQSEKWYWRGNTCFLVIMAIDYIRGSCIECCSLCELLESFITNRCNIYCLARAIVAFWRELGNRKDPGYNVFAGPAYTVTLPPVDRDLNVDGQFENSDDAHIFEYREKFSFDEYEECFIFQY